MPQKSWSLKAWPSLGPKYLKSLKLKKKVNMANVIDIQNNYPHVQCLNTFYDGMKLMTLSLPMAKVIRKIAEIIVPSAGKEKNIIDSTF